MNLLIKSFRKSSLWCLYHDKLEVSVYKTIKKQSTKSIVSIGCYTNCTQIAHDIGKATLTFLQNSSTKGLKPGT
jgi:hypothetical protein